MLSDRRIGTQQLRQCEPGRTIDSCSTIRNEQTFKKLPIEAPSARNTKASATQIASNLVAQSLVQGLGHLK